MILKPRPFRKPDLGHPLSRGLVGCWLMTEGGGNIVQDLSGNGLHGTFAGDPTWTAGSDGPAITFDGTGDSIPLTSSLIKTPTVTVVAKVKMDSFVGAIGAGIVASNNSQLAWRLTTTTTNDTIKFSINAYNTDIAFGTSNLSTGTYYSLAGLYDGTNVKVYVDGVSGTPVAAAGPITYGVDFEIGRQFTTDTYAFEGDIEFVYIFNRALSPTEIQSLYINPYQMFRRKPIELWTAASPAAAPGGVVIFRRRIAG